MCLQNCEIAIYTPIYSAIYRWKTVVRGSDCVPVMLMVVNHIRAAEATSEIGFDTFGSQYVQQILFSRAFTIQLYMVSRLCWQ